MVYYVVYTDETNDYVITDSEEKAIKVYDKMVDDNPEWQCLHFSTWEEEDPEGYQKNCPIEEFADDSIYDEKFENWNEVIEYLKAFRGAMFE